MDLEFLIKKDDLIEAKTALINKCNLDFKSSDKFIIKNLAILVPLTIFIYIISILICFNNNLNYLFSATNFYITAIILIVISLLLSLEPIITSRATSKTWRYNLFKINNTWLTGKFMISIENNNLRIFSGSLKITTPLITGNIRQNNNTLFVFDCDRFLIIIPLSRVNDKNNLLNTIEKYIEVTNL